MTKRLIALVDDDMYVRKSIKTILEEIPEIEIFEKEDGQQLVDYFSNLKIGEKVPNLIISDYEMPNKNGLEAIIKIRTKKEYKNIQVIFQSGNPSNDLKFYIISNPTNTYFLMKPANVNEIIENVNKCLSSNQ